MSQDFYADQPDDVYQCSAKPSLAFKRFNCIKATSRYYGLFREQNPM